VDTAWKFIPAGLVYLIVAGFIAVRISTASR
jgi:hypothetical protein